MKKEKIKFKMVRIEEQARRKLMKYCKEKGLKAYWFVSRAIEEKIENGKRK